MMKNMLTTAHFRRMGDASKAGKVAEIDTSVRLAIERLKNSIEEIWENIGNVQENQAGGYDADGNPHVTSLSQGGQIVLTLENTSGGWLSYGDVVVFDPAATDSCTTTTTANDLTVCGVVATEDPDGGGLGNDLADARQMIIRQFFQYGFHLFTQPDLRILR